jgi:hypothetical protein
LLPQTVDSVSSKVLSAVRQDIKAGMLEGT